MNAPEKKPLTPPAADAAPRRPSRAHRIAVPGVRRSDRSGRTVPLPGLLSEAGLSGGSELPGVPVAGVVADSRRVRPGYVFVAIEGRSDDGHHHVADAVARGAVAVVAERDLDCDPGVPVVRVTDGPRALARLCDRICGSPAQALRLCGITGTNGKTTTAWLTQAALEFAGVPTGLVSSVIHRSRGGIRAATHSTPPADRLHPLLLEMKQAGEEACVIEASSHGLAQGRLDGVPFGCAVCTNLSSAHLDYHGSLAEYLHAKAELFRALPRDAVAILSRDDPTWELLREETLARVVTFGIEGGGDFRGRIVRLDRLGSELDVITPLGTVRVRSGLVGRHNASNIVAALAAAVALGAEPEATAVGISGDFTLDQ